MQVLHDYMPHSIPRQNKENTKEGEEGIKIVKNNIFQRLSHFKIEVTLIDKKMTESLEWFIHIRKKNNYFTNEKI